LVKNDLLQAWGGLVTSLLGVVRYGRRQTRISLLFITIFLHFAASAVLTIVTPTVVGISAYNQPFQFTNVTWIPTTDPNQAELYPSVVAWMQYFINLNSSTAIQTAGLTDR
jgi:hypothetical protein